LYPTLTTRERMRLVRAAETREDVAEVTRLRLLSPTHTLQLPDYLLPSLKLDILALIFASEQLESLAGYWHATRRSVDAQDERPAEWAMLADSAAYRFAVGQRAWDRFCRSVGADGEQLVRSNYLGFMLDLCGATLCELAPTREQVREQWRRHGHEGEPITEDELYQSWCRLFGSWWAQFSREVGTRSKGD
jgi:hypothetical protein